MSHRCDGGSGLSATSDLAALDITGSAFAYSFWLKPERVNSGDAVMTKWNNDFTAQQQYRIRCGPTGQNEFSIRGSSVTYTVNSAASMTANVWHHVGGRLTGTGAGLFEAWLNGVATTGTAAQAIQNTAEFFKIGYEGTGNNFLGSIAEVAVWNSGLTSDQMLALSKGVNPLQIQFGNLKYYHPFNYSDDRRDLVLGTSFARSNALIFQENDHPPVGRYALMPS